MPCARHRPAHRPGRTGRRCAFHIAPQQTPFQARPIYSRRSPTRGGQVEAWWWRCSVSFTERIAKYHTLQSVIGRQLLPLAAGSLKSAACVPFPRSTRYHNPRNACHLNQKRQTSSPASPPPHAHLIFRHCYYIPNRFKLDANVNAR